MVIFNLRNNRQLIQSIWLIIIIVCLDDQMFQYSFVLCSRIFIKAVYTDFSMIVNFLFLILVSGLFVGDL